jgi:hypothetical protein
MNVGAAKNKNVRINKSALNVTVTYLFEVNWIVKQPNIITLEKLQSNVKISQLLQLLSKKEYGMTHVIINSSLLMTPKLKTVRVILMCALDFGGMESVTGNSSSNGHLSSQSLFKTRISMNCWFLINFFVWDKTRTSSTFVFKVKTA